MLLFFVVPQEWKISGAIKVVIDASTLLQRTSISSVSGEQSSLRCSHSPAILGRCSGGLKAPQVPGTPAFLACLQSSTPGNPSMILHSGKAERLHCSSSCNVKSETRGDMFCPVKRINCALLHRITADPLHLATSFSSYRVTCICLIVVWLRNEWAKEMLRQENFIRCEPL